MFLHHDIRNFSALRSSCQSQRTISDKHSPDAGFLIDEERISLDRIQLRHIGL
jgi:hypothetical protein